MSGRLPVMEDEEGSDQGAEYEEPVIHNGVNVSLLNDLFADDVVDSSEQDDSDDYTFADRTRSFVFENVKQNRPVDIVYDCRLLSNSVAMLKDLCKARQLGLPEYRIEKRRDHNNIATFHVTGTVLNFSMDGIGSSQDVAKNDSAYKLYQKIVNLSKVEPRTLPRAVVDGSLNLKTAKFVFSNTKHVFKRFFDMLDFTDDRDHDKTENLAKLRALQLPNVSVLDMIGKFEDFDVNYYIVEQNLTADNDHIEMLVQLSTNPIMYLTATGGSVELAQESAAYDILLNFGSML